ncbi:MAG: enolase C-terminal domain-like protein, partial [Bacteroidales bacterium]|nr:enolase C-terminal domain-like protein [Bacteroidales bacterium]
MKIKATYRRYTLYFKQPAGTSRGVYRDKEVYYLFLTANEFMRPGIGECNVLRGLSYDDRPGYEENLAHLCRKITAGDFDWKDPLCAWPSVRFALDTALADLQRGGEHILFPSAFTRGTRGIITNGLVWMDHPERMRNQAEEKIQQGFRCIKIKIGMHPWAQEHALLANLRSRFASDELCLRVDANGAFREENVFSVLDDLAKLEVHSVEQPVGANDQKLMAAVCRKSPVAVALDESLIGVCTDPQREALLDTLKPQFLILKPALCGGFAACEKWIALASSKNIGWWATSALESDVGLNAIV